jgi:hypothetical protein
MLLCDASLVVLTLQPSSNVSDARDQTSSVTMALSSCTGIISDYKLTHFWSYYFPTLVFSCDSFAIRGLKSFAMRRD